MGSASVGAVRIIDASGDACDDDSGRLNVNATIQAGDLNVGNVDIQLAGTAVSGNTGVYDSGTLRVTLAANDPLTTLMVADLDTIAGDTTDIAGHFSQTGGSYAQRKGIAPIVVRNDELAAVLLVLQMGIIRNSR